MSLRHSNLGPGGCVPWGDFATWLRRVDIHMKALESLVPPDEPGAPSMYVVAHTLREEIDAAMVVYKVERT